mgnify:CR=1 FL=1
MAFWIVSACSTAPESKENSRKINIDLSSEKSIGLSEICENVQYIHLETSDECLVDYIRDLVVKDSLIYLSTNKQVYKFNTKGRFISTIGRYGKGPGEYPGIGSGGFDVDDNRIVVQPNALKTIVYDLDGNLLEEIKQEKCALLAIKLHNNNLYWANPFPRFLSHNNFSLMAYDFSDKKYSHYLDRSGYKMEEDKSIPLLLGVNLYSFHDTISYWERKFHTVYRMVDGKVIPRYIFNFDNREPCDYQGFRDRVSDVLDYNIMFTMHETDNYFFFRFMPMMPSSNKYYIFSKPNQTTWTTSEEYDYSIKNDYDGGFPFWPMGQLDDGRLWCQFSKIELRNLLKKKEYSEITAMHPDKKKELLRLCEESTIMDNPTIMLVTLK